MGLEVSKQRKFHKLVPLGSQKFLSTAALWWSIKHKVFVQTSWSDALEFESCFSINVLLFISIAFVVALLSAQRCVLIIFCLMSNVMALFYAFCCKHYFCWP